MKEAGDSLVSSGVNMYLIYGWYVVSRSIQLLIR